MNTAGFEIFEKASAGTDLLERSRKALASAPADRVQRLAERVPESFIPEENPIRIVFAGQYSAGKSSIIKALTGCEEIEIGAGITTDTTRTYAWNGVRLIDTPGVHTGVRPDHDETAYHAVAQADLLVFVVTKELFDAHIGRHFRKLAVDRDKANEMMLVVNKMGRHFKGNGPEARAVLLQDLCKVVAPFSPEKLRTTFIDAKYALDSETEPDHARADLLRQKSGMERLVQELNRFIREKGLMGRCTTVLYTLEQILQEAIAAEPAGDEDADALKELLLQRRRALQETRDRIPGAAEGKINEAGAKIRGEGRKAADRISGTADPERIDAALQAAGSNAEGYVGRLEESLPVIFETHMDDLEHRMEGIVSSELAKVLLPRLRRRMEAVSVSPETLQNIKAASEVSGKLGDFLVRNAFRPDAVTFRGLFKLNQYTKTPVNDLVKRAGGYFGKSFKPWEAAKLTRTIANIGRGMAIVGTVGAFLCQIKEDLDADNREKGLQEMRAGVRTDFNDYAYEIEMEYDAKVKTFVADTIGTDLEEVDRQLAELEAIQKEKSDLFRLLHGLLEETRAMIRDIHAGEKPAEKI